MKTKLTLLIFSLLLVITGCSGVSKEELNKAASDNEKLAKQVEEYKLDKERLEEKVLRMTDNSITSFVLFDEAERYLTSDVEKAKSYLLVLNEQFSDSKEAKKGRDILKQLAIEEEADLESKGENSSATINLSEFNKLKNGMSYEEVKKIIGGPGVLTSESGNIQMYSYTGEGQLGANAILMFVDGELSVKSQYGL